MRYKKYALKIKLWLDKQKISWHNRGAIKQLVKPNQIVFQNELIKLFNTNQAWLEETAGEYQNCPAAWRYLSGVKSASRASDGLAKSLDLAEGFVLWALVKHCRPRVVVELGVQYGVSARLWKEALTRYVPDHELILCDTQDQRLLIQDDECTFILGNALETLPQIFKTHKVDLLHNDAHPYKLIHWSVSEALKQDSPILTFHDVGAKHPRANFKAESFKASPNEKRTNELDLRKYGHWERHVMAEIFDPGILTQDYVQTEEFQLQIFDSLFGVGIVIKK